MNQSHGYSSNGVQQALSRQREFLTCKYTLFNSYIYPQESTYMSASYITCNS